MDQRKLVTPVGPENSETPLDAHAGWITPNRLFFVRNHFDVPQIADEAWRLTVNGLVDRELTLDLEAIKKLPSHTVMATVECAGNGRSFLRDQPGVQWGAGAIGHGEWTGVRLRDVLEQAGLDAKCHTLVFTGADEGNEGGQRIHFARALPIEKAMHPDTLLATRMNGEPLEPNHGAPLRLFVPGWYGVASVKWLAHVEAVDQPFEGYFQTTKYTIQRESEGPTQTRSLGPMFVKSEILRPRPGETVRAGVNRVFGLAWAGESPVAGVEVSTDGGHTWRDATLMGPSAAYSWRMWEIIWDVAESGSHTLIARARAASGEAQPMSHDSLCGGYVINFSRKTIVIVETGEPSQDQDQDQAGDAQAILYDMQLFAEENAQRQLDVDMDIEYADGGGI